MKFGEKANKLKLIRSIKTDQVRFIIPKFITVGSSVFNKWITGEEIDSNIMGIIEEMKINGLNDKDIIIRSSAVYSEDGDSLTGAGVYDSVIANSSEFKDVKKAIIKVFKSVNSEQAIKYRNDNSIQNEEMGLVIQEYIKACCTGTINTTQYHTKDIFYFSINDGHITINKGSGDFHLPYDNYKTGIMSEETIALSKKVFEVGKHFEGLFNRPVQIEYGYNTDSDELFIFQVRPIPKNMLALKSISNRTDKYIFSAHSVGVYDGILNVTSYDSASEVIQNIILGNTINHIDKGLVVFGNGACASMSNKFSLSIPKEGAVLTLGKHSDGHGHIETLCVEKGIACISDDIDKSSADEILEILRMYKKVHIISDGTIGKIYSPIINEEVVFEWIINFIKNRNDDCSFLDTTYEAFVDAFYEEMGENCKYVSPDYVLNIMYKKRLLERKRSNFEGLGDIFQYSLISKT